jgi:hypothetical protein
MNLASECGVGCFPVFVIPFTGDIQQAFQRTLLRDWIALL